MMRQGTDLTRASDGVPLSHEFFENFEWHLGISQDASQHLWVQGCLGVIRNRDALSLVVLEVLWLPLCRVKTKPLRSSTRMTSAAVTLGSFGIRPRYPRT